VQDRKIPAGKSGPRIIRANRVQHEPGPIQNHRIRGGSRGARADEERQRQKERAQPTISPEKQTIEPHAKTNFRSSYCAKELVPQYLSPGFLIFQKTSVLLFPLQPGARIRLLVNRDPNL
jgi:hypothetical protein